MRMTLVGALVLSIGFNAYLLFSRTSNTTTPPTSAPPSDDAPTLQSRTLASRASSSETESLRVVALERELEALKERYASLESITPAEIAQLSNLPLDRRLRLILALPEADQQAVAWKIGAAWANNPERAGEVLRALVEETDSAALRILSFIIRGGGAASGGPKRATVAFDLLRSGEPKERRAAAVWLLAQGPRTGTGQEDQRVLAEWVAALSSIALREPEPEVLEALADSTESWWAIDEAFSDALESRLEEMPAGSSRRRVLSRIGRARFFKDGGESLWSKWNSATSKETKEDVAHALGLLCNQVSTPGNPSDESWRTSRIVWRQRIADIFASTTDAATRRDLLRATQFGMPLAFTKTEHAAWLRRVADTEPDAAQRERILAWATALEGTEWADPDEYLRPKRPK